MIDTVAKFMPEAICRGWVIKIGDRYRPTPKGIAAADSIVQYDEVAWRIYDDAHEDQQGAAVMAILICAIRTEPAWLRFLRRFTG
jgi:hypothetical protein